MNCEVAPAANDCFQTSVFQKSTRFIIRAPFSQVLMLRYVIWYADVKISLHADVDIC